MLRYREDTSKIYEAHTLVRQLITRVSQINFIFFIKKIFFDKGARDQFPFLRVLFTAHHQTNINEQTFC